MKRFRQLNVAVCLAMVCWLPLSAQTGQNNPAGKGAVVTQVAQAVGAQAAPGRPDPRRPIIEVIDRIYNYLNGCTPAVLVDEKGKEVTDFSKIDRNTAFKKGDFGLTTYEWGVTYSGMLKATEATGDQKYAEYTYQRLRFLGKIYPHAKRYAEATGYPMRISTMVTPRFLDDCGAVCAAMIKAGLANPAIKGDFREAMEEYFNFVMYQEYRLGSGVLARNRPSPNSVWLDDMYMGIPPIAYRGKLSQAERGDLTQKFYNEAVNQIRLFKEYLWVPEEGMFRHGWIESMSVRPDYFWARCNGWAVLTLCDVLDALPANVQGREFIIETLRDLLFTLAKYQSGTGTWHQLINRNDSYLETSASAMFVYGIAHAINQGWIDRTAFQEVAQAGWKAVAAQVNARGQVENTCVGTGLGWTPVFYYTRPVSVYAAHGYGPVLLAASEMIKMMDGGNRQDGRGPQAMQRDPFSPIGGVGMMNQRPGYSRSGSKPVILLIGDSTCKNGAGDGSNGQWGWGSFFGDYINDKATVENHALGGLSSRTFYNSNWAAVRDAIKPGDYVLIQFGHNDMAPLNTGRARGTLTGTDPKPEVVVMEKHGGPEKVYSYGQYIRLFVQQTRMRGGIPVVLSPTLQNSWRGANQVAEFSETFNKWCEEVAREEGVTFINLNSLAAEAYNQAGRTKAQADYFVDSVHTTEAAAKLNCELIGKGIKASKSDFAQYLK